MSKLVETKTEEQEARITELIEAGKASGIPAGKMAKEIVPQVLSGEVTAEQFGAYLVGRAVRKYA